MTRFLAVVAIVLLAACAGDIRPAAPPTVAQTFVISMQIG
jgi:hypothetical protein